MDAVARLLNELDELRHLVQASELSEGDPERLLVEVGLLKEEAEAFAAGRRGLHDVMEWEGTGEEFWRTLDVDKYIREERQSWR